MEESIAQDMLNLEISSEKLVLQSLLKKSFGSEVTIENYTANKRFVPRGESFGGSDLIKVDINLRRTKDSPVEVLHCVWKKYCDGDDSCEKEVFVYESIIPFYKKIELENGIDENETIDRKVPKLYGYSLSNKMSMLMENIQEKNYVSMGKRIGLYLQQTKLATRLLARFHALGIATRKKYPKKFEEFKRNGTDSLNTYYLRHINDLNAVLKALSLYDGFTEIDILTYTNYLEGPDDEYSWGTITHCDYWTNNAMCRRNSEGGYDDVNFIDFQNFTYARATWDLPFFLTNSMNDEIKLDHFDEMIDLYYETFVATLKNVNVEVDHFSRQSFDLSLKFDARNEFLHCAVALFYFAIEWDRNLVKSALKSEVFVKRLTDLVKIYKRKDWFYKRSDLIILKNENIK